MQISTTPKDMLVGVTSRCNHKCIFCDHYESTVEKKEIDSAFLERILQEAYDMGVRKVGLYSTGESFMCKDLAAHVYNAKKMGYEYVYMDTNGALATREKLESVITAGLDSIKFSINAGTRETYALVHGSDDFEKVVNNLKNCYELKKTLNNKLKIFVSFVVVRQSENEIEALRNIVAPYINKFFIYPLWVYGRRQRSADELRPLSMDITKTKIPCTMVFDRIHITPDGFLSACCSDFHHDLIIGDLNTTSLKDTWESEKACAIREKHLNNSLEGFICHTCWLSGQQDDSYSDKRDKKC